VKNIRTTATAIGSALALAAVLVPMTSAAAATGDEQLATVDSPLITQDAAGYQGRWTIEGGAVKESFQRDGVIISTGSSSLRSGLAADSIVSFGYVAGFGDLDSGEDYAQLSGQAGTDVTAVRVVSASGVETEADLADGIWGAVWLAGDDAEEYGAATLEFDTAVGTTTVSTDVVDVIASDQRAAENG
jgi:hypothetical protein